jgi:hypothetical protein
MKGTTTEAWRRGSGVASGIFIVDWAVASSGRSSRK